MPKSKKPEINKEEDTSSKDLALITQMNNEHGSLDLKETLQNALEVIIKELVLKLQMFFN